MADEPQTIRQKLNGIPEKVRTKPDFGDLLADKAISAILDGPSSPAWTAYMMLIISSDPHSLQLQRLTNLENAPAEVQKSSAYMVANGACGPATGGQTGNGVDFSLFNDLPAEP
jgi:hypothetical protein